jgi:hypothetical protein
MIRRSAEKQRLDQLAEYYRANAQALSLMARNAKEREMFALEAADNSESIKNTAQQIADWWESMGKPEATSESRHDASNAAARAAELRVDAAVAKRDAQRFTALRAKYEAAAAKPWIPIDPD